jgi:cytochrome c
VKKYYVAIAFLAFLGACGDNKTENKDAKAGAAATVATDNSANPDYQKGLELIAKSDCLTCHKVSEKLTGPAYKDVAAKYENTDANVTLLAEKDSERRTGCLGTDPYDSACSIKRS